MELNILPMYPANQSKSFKHDVFIGIGSNLKDPLNQCRQAIILIKEMRNSHVDRVSSFYKSPPLPWEGAKNQPWYVNAVLKVNTDLDPFELWESLRRIEKKMGRVRRMKWEPRLIDLDILFYDHLTFSMDGLQIPHPELTNRRFVLEPLKEIDSQWEHPLKKLKISELAQRIEHQSIIEKI